jgi:PKHD-type hydroxylase
VAANEHFELEVESIQEPLLYAEYEAGDYFDWHSDHSPGPVATRKISCSIMLSEDHEFEGGKLQFCPGSTLLNFGFRGTGAFFPSYVAHRVTPVKSGVRRVLIAWMHGRPLC